MRLLLSETSPMPLNTFKGWEKPCSISIKSKKRPKMSLTSSFKRRKFKVKYLTLIRRSSEALSISSSSLINGLTRLNMQLRMKKYLRMSKLKSETLVSRYSWHWAWLRSLTSLLSEVFYFSSCKNKRNRSWLPSKQKIWRTGARGLRAISSSPASVLS